MIDFEKNDKLVQFTRETENFLLAGPSLFGWIMGILRFPVKSKKFLVSLVSGILSTSFLTMYGIINTMYVFFDFPSDMAVRIIYSVLSFSYLSLSFTIFVLYRKGKRIPSIDRVQSFLDRLTGITKPSV